MKTENCRIVALYAMVFLCVLVSLAPADPTMKPQNYSQVKAMLDAYAGADDMMDDKLIAARETLRAKGNEVVSALLAIFKDNTDDHYRAAIVDALQHNNGDKAVASNFLAQQLDVGVAQWQGEIWISSAIKFLAVFDPVQARKISRNALDAKSSFVKQAALSTLSAVGNSEDIPFLQNFLARQRLLIQAEANNELVKKGDDAVKTISHRQSAEKNSN